MEKTVAKTSMGTIVVMEAPKGQELHRNYAQNIVDSTDHMQWDELLDSIEGTRDISIDGKLNGIVDVYYDEVGDMSYLHVQIEKLL
jgi:hypothetical protein